MFDEFRPIDMDPHIAEPPGVWTARVSKKRGDSVPRTRRVNGANFWFDDPSAAGIGRIVEFVNAQRKRA